MKNNAERAIGGFTLLEVMIAIGILSISLVAIFDVQATSIQSAGRVKFLTAATLLARSKMVDIEQELTEKGFSDFEEQLDGNFEEEGWPRFRWTAVVSKVKIPLPGSMPGEEDNPYAGMMSGYASLITDLISNALRECIVTVEWDEGGETQQVALATHFIEIGRANMLESSGNLTETTNQAATDITTNDLSDDGLGGLKSKTTKDGKTSESQTK